MLIFADFGSNKSEKFGTQNQCIIVAALFNALKVSAQFVVAGKYFGWWSLILYPELTKADNLVLNF